MPLNPRPLLDCQAFPLLFVRAAGDEGDTVLLGHPAILTGLVIGRNGSPGDAPPNVLFSAFCELLSNHLPRGGGSGESRGRRIGSLPGDFGPPWTEVSEVWVRGGRMLHNSDKEFALTMGADAECLKAGTRGEEGLSLIHI